MSSNAESPTPALPQNAIERRGTGLVAVDPHRVADGYTLFTPIAGAGEVYLIDNGGEVVHTWHAPYPPGRHARLLPNGNLLYQGKIDDHEPLFPIWGVYHGGVIAELEPDGTVLREVRHPRHHHDATLLANGNLILATVEALTPEQSALVVGGTPGTEANGNIVYGDVIVEIDWNGTVVWRWSAFEKLPLDEFALHSDFPREHWPMANTVNETADGDVIVGFRTASRVVRISRETSEVNWTLGAPHVAQQHYPHELPNGNILVFDNGTFRAGENFPYSRAVELDPSTDTEVWTWQDNPPQNFYSPYMSSAQRLPNGNTLIAEGSFGRIFEVDPDGLVVWEYIVPFFGAFAPGVGLNSSVGGNNSIFRAYKYGADEIPWLPRE
ncbi:aryl sulfotransferase [Rhodococcus sp. 06-412-2C]|uniref:aryl-sulfate sulfotransferase n=1 Tax=unclassified Rhodococcus (in: high G+C Gram-positive bacteria) TaxID=192944 RepID=UPI000B9B71C9|nr:MULTISPECIES: aryl-sulfate sulfotransferase [unclassified Rhodococcus (in: high G+C Gram-positive bacteria)]OZC90621.1 aryl sulfotransferase [Rhodococcus sp. 06-412-2C]OZC98123.1 aryl sulfotransferase [Rhodococcus sp. 06-412-2B]